MAIWLPKWSVDRLRRLERRSPERRHDRRPLLLVDRDRQRQVVARCCERASEQGVRPGMPAAQARALFEPGGVRIEPHDAGADDRALEALAAWAMRFSPLLQRDPPNGLLLDVTGCGRVFGGEVSLAQRASDSLRQLGIRARVVVAPTFASARALARYGEHRVQVVQLASLRTTLAPIPVAGLALEQDTIDALAELGIERVEHLLDLPRSTLPARFGDKLLLRLDQALGHAIEPFEPLRPTEPIAAEREFAGPTDRIEAIEITARDLLAAVTEELQRRELGARAIAVTLVRSDLPPETLEIRMGRPSRDATHLWKLLAPKLERAQLGFGVEAVRIEAVSTARVRHTQAMQLAGTNDAAPADADADRAAAELFDTIANRLGPERVMHAELVPSHLPERACTFRPAGAAEPSRSFQPASCDRPTLLFDHPETADVVALTPDGPVHSVRWRRAAHTIVSCIGPERLSPEWWRSVGSTRDYFRVQTDAGRWLWLARSLETNRWFVHGVWA
ncbi:MAG: DNA polymerase Y family protein [Planctomycetota bacterium]